MSKQEKATTLSKSNKWIFGTMLVFGAIGLLVSFILANEEIHLMKNPGAVLSCSINIVLNCSTVMQSWQASAFGFPNMFIGLMGYPVVITTAVVALAGLAGKLPRWYWRVATICYALGALFAYWLFFNSVYVIQVLCPWCLVVTFSTTIILSTIMHYSLRENIFGFKDSLNSKIQAFLKKDYGKFAVAAWIVLLIALVIIKFGDSLFA